MKGWILLEDNEIVYGSENSFDVFKTKKDLFNFYGGSLGERNSIMRLKITEYKVEKRKVREK